MEVHGQLATQTALPLGKEPLAHVE